MKYAAIPQFSGPGANVPSAANGSGNYKPPKRSSFPANTNRAPVKAPSRQAHRNAAKAFGKKMAQNVPKAAASAASAQLGRMAAARAAAALLGPAGLLLTAAYYAYQYGKAETPGQPAKPAGFHGLQLMASNRFAAQGPAAASIASSPNQGFIDLVKREAGGLTKLSSASQTVGKNSIVMHGPYSWKAAGQYYHSQYWYGPMTGDPLIGTPTPAQPEVAPQPAVAPKWAPQPAQAPQPRRAPRVRPRGNPQRRPGISVNRNPRPNSLGTLDLTVTGTRVKLRLNSENRPPRSGTKEVKGKSKSWGALMKMHKLANMATEAVDFLEVLAKATGYEGEDGAENFLDMAKHVQDNLELFDIDVFFEEYVKMQAQDMAVGKGSAHIDKMSKKLIGRSVELGIAL